MEKTITILPEKEWLTTAEAAQVLGKSERVVQQMAKDGDVKSKLAGPPYPHNARLYDAKDIRKYIPAEPRPKPKPSSVRRREARKVVRSIGPSSSSGAELMVVNELRRKGWLTPRECYRLEGLPSRKVVELVEQGELEGVRAGKSWRIRRASLEAFSRKGADESSGEAKLKRRASLEAFAG